MTQLQTTAPVSAQPVSSENKKKKEEKSYGQKTVKFYADLDPHTERVLWYISHLHRRVWNNMLSICNADFSLIDTLLDKVNPKGREEIRKLKEFAETMPPIEKTFEHNDGTSTTVSIKPSWSLSEFGMLYALGPMRNADPELLQLPLNDLQKPCRVLAKSWKSFFELRKRGDKKARSPRMKNDLFFFTLQWEKPKLVEKDGRLYLSVNHKIPGVDAVLIPVPKNGMIVPKPKEKRADGDDTHCSLSEFPLRYVTINRMFPFHDRPSRFEVNIVYETEKVEVAPIGPATRYAGVDNGTRRKSLALEDGTSKTWYLPKWDQYFTKQRQIIEARMATKVKGSRAYIALYDARTKISKRWADKQKDLQRKIAHDMVQYADVFFVGETAVRLGLAQSEGGTKGQHRAAQNTGHLSRFPRFLMEKAIECGKRVIMVPDFISDADKAVRKVESAVRHLEYGLARPELLEK
ncbi:MAG TPA: transposase [Candidatus Paceibacterota bacterium]|nr:transposase [Candidatus Paceibacterota bacterium]